MTQLLPPKKEVALALLERSNVDVYLDPRARGVVVPPQFRKEPRLILKIGLNMPVPIPDLRLDEESMSCTLSFNRSPFYCVVPWSSVFAMVGEDGRGMVWPDDVPQELAVKVVEPGAEGEGAPQSAGGPALPATATPNVTGRRAARASKLADDPSSNATASADKGRSQKKKKPSAPGTKKEESTRPTLVAVPSGPSSASSSEEAPRARGSRPASSPSAPSAPRTPPPASPPQATGSNRPKRELPPYLRVVK